VTTLYVVPALYSLVIRDDPEATAAHGEAHGGTHGERARPPHPA
jgi:hypothetical protein